MYKAVRAACAALFAAFFAALGFAQAQNVMPSTNATISTISPAEMIEILKSIEFAAAMTEESSDGTKVIEATSDGAAIYFALRKCADAGANGRCEVIQPFGVFQAQGVTLDQINTFNRDVSSIAAAALLPNGTGAIVSKVYLTHGITIANLYFVLGVYFSDIGALLKAIEPGALAQVKYEARAVDAGALGLPSLKAGYAMNGTGANAPDFITAPLKEILHRGAKIEN